MHTYHVQRAALRDTKLFRSELYFILTYRRVASRLADDKVRFNNYYLLFGQHFTRGFK